MTMKEFTNNVYKPTAAKNSGRKINQIDDKDRMILAIAECGVAVDTNEYKEYEQTIALLNEIDGTNNKPSRLGVIKQAASTWRVDETKLMTNIKKLFS